MPADLTMPTIDQLLRKEDKSVFEPAVPTLLKKSAFFVNTVGMREAPERLILELFREVLFKSHVNPNDAKARVLEPHQEQALEEQALLHIGRGRTKKSRRIVGVTYFGPIYPELARNAWPRKQTERVVNFQLISGPLAQYVLDKRADANAIAEEVVTALTGRARGKDGGQDVFREILSRISVDPNEAQLFDKQQAIDELADRIQGVKGSALDYGLPDQLAVQLAEDFLNLCRLEGRVPRLLWIDLLKCFLRIGLSTWLLAHMKLTVYLRDWSLAAMGGEVETEEVILESLQSRWQGIFHPTQTGSNEVMVHIERYVKARVELSLLTYLVRYKLGEQAINATLSARSTNKDHVSVTEWLTRCRQAGVKLGLKGSSNDVRTKIIPFAQKFGAWLNPSAKGQGKNIAEFLRILLRLRDSDEDDGYLLTGTGKGEFQRVVVFPGPAMIKTMLYLVAEQKMAGPSRNRGKLVLADLEQHFSQYGVDFASSVGARPQLIAELSRMGLLKGSPDAGDGAELISPEFM